MHFPESQPMNAPLSDDLLRQLRADGLPRISTQLGVSPREVDEATAAAIPLLMGAIGRVAREDGGAEALYDILARDHQGLDPGNVLGTAIGGGGNGAGILRHVLGGREPLAAQTLGAIGGLGEGRALLLMRMLAPVVMAFIARRLFTPADAAGTASPEPSPQGLVELLQHEEQAMASRDGFGAGLLAVLDEQDEGEVDLQDFARSRDPAALDVQTAEMRSPRPLL